MTITGRCNVMLQNYAVILCWQNKTSSYC